MIPQQLRQFSVSETLPITEVLVNISVECFGLANLHIRQNRRNFRLWFA